MTFGTTLVDTTYTQNVDTANVNIANIYIYIYTVHTFNVCNADATETHIVDIATIFIVDTTKIFNVDPNNKPFTYTFNWDSQRKLMLTQARFLEARVQNCSELQNITVNKRII